MQPVIPSFNPTAGFSSGPSAIPPRTAVGTARPGSAARRGQIAAGGVALATGMAVADRPVTQSGGLAGAGRPNTAATRQVADKNFYMGLIRNKNEELSAELGRIRAQLEKMGQDATSRPRLLQAQTAVQEEAKKLKETLEVQNMIQDKLHQQDEAQEIMKAAASLKSTNNLERRKQDHIFTEKRNWEEKTKELEQQLQQLYGVVEQRLSYDPDMQTRWRRLVQESNTLLATRLTEENNNTKLGAKVAALEKELQQSDPTGRLAAHFAVLSELADLEAARNELQQRSSASGGDSARHSLLQKINNDKLEVRDLEARKAALHTQAHTAAAAAEAARVQRPAPPPGSDEEKMQKMQTLLDNEKAIDAEIAGFDENMKREVQKLAILERNICGLLEHISRGMMLQTNMPTASRLREMQDDLTYKETLAEQTQNTMTRVQADYQHRKKEWQKVQGAEEKLDKKIQMLTQKYETMRKEIALWADTGAARAQADAKMQASLERKQKLAMLKNSLVQQVFQANAEFETLQHRLVSQDSFAMMENMERNIAERETQNFQMRDFLAANAATGNFQSLTSECTQLLEKLNQKLINGLVRGNRA